ncbi:unnamed protein product [Vicia faba]|uniref:Uncharacterized protein n=1 Tax=Vicia faba TaxID=3906 RepID=A0AAV1B8B2_VICFA|nr:unnamed protein product [Vicia faba]
MFLVSNFIFLKRCVMGFRGSLSSHTVSDEYAPSRATANMSQTNSFNLLIISSSSYVFTDKDDEKSRELQEMLLHLKSRKGDEDVAFEIGKKMVVVAFLQKVHKSFDLKVMHEFVEVL